MQRSANSLQTSPSRIPRVCIVDPEQMTSVCIAAFLHTKMKVWCIENDALDVLKLLENGHNIDLVISAVHNYTIDGLTLCYAIKKDWPSVKVILTTSYKPDEERQEAAEMGADGFLVKPILLEDLWDIIQKLGIAR